MESFDTEVFSLKIAEYEHTLVEFVTAWNRAEAALRGLLIRLCEATPASFILVSELGALGLAQSLSALTADRFDEDAKAAIGHAIKFFNQVREFRNYYVHGIGLVAFNNQTGEAFGVIDIISSKARLAAHQENIGIGELTKASDNAKQLWYLIQLLLRLLPGLTPGPPQIGLTLAELPQQYPLPARLQKPRSYLLEDFWRDPLPTQESPSET